MVYTPNRQGTAVRTKVTPRNPKSAAQVTQRARFTAVSQAWRGPTICRYYHGKAQWTTLPALADPGRNARTWPKKKWPASTPSRPSLKPSRKRFSPATASGLSAGSPLRRRAKRPLIWRRRPTPGGLAGGGLRQSLEHGNRLSDAASCQKGGTRGGAGQWAGQRLRKFATRCGGRLARRLIPVYGDNRYFPLSRPAATLSPSDGERAG